MWFVLSLIALLCWSGSDMFSKIGSRPSDKLSHWKMVMAVGLVMGLHAAYEVFVGGVEITWGVIVAYLPASILYILSMTLGYVGLRYIELSVSSPICNSSGGIAAVLCFLFLQEMPSLVQWIGVIAVTVGVVLLGAVELTESDYAREMRQKNSRVKYDFLQEDGGGIRRPSGAAGQSARIDLKNHPLFLTQRMYCLYCRCEIPPIGFVKQVFLLVKLRHQIKMSDNGGGYRFV